MTGKEQEKEERECFVQQKKAPHDLYHTPSFCHGHTKALRGEKETIHNHTNKQDEFIQTFICMAFRCPRQSLTWASLLLFLSSMRHWMKLEVHRQKACMEQNDCMNWPLGHYKLLLARHSVSLCCCNDRKAAG